MAKGLDSGNFGHGFEDAAFSVVRFASGASSLLAHELGHNQGAGHDRDTSPGGLYSSSRGHRFTGTGDGTCVGGDYPGDDCASHGDCGEGGTCKRGTCVNGSDVSDICADDSDCGPACLGGANHADSCSVATDCPDGLCQGICVRWRTTMAYPPGSHIDYFSNPNISFDGAPTGIANGENGEADHAKTLNESADVVANFRASHYWVDFNYPGFLGEWGCFLRPYNTLSEGINAAPIGGTLHIKAGSTDETPILSKKMRFEAEGGSVFIGTP
jgi:hypothetical protein